MNLDNLIEIMEMLGGELRPVSQWPLSVYNYQSLENLSASLSDSARVYIAENSGATSKAYQPLDAFLDDISWAGEFHNLFFYQKNEGSL